MKKYFVILLFMSFSIFTMMACKADNNQIDKILILKSERKLILLSQGNFIKEYKVSLGLNPKGTKVFEGDYKTPEGTYRIDWRHFSKKFNLSMHVSYPSEENKEYAKKFGRSAGGMIMIHGTPKNGKFPESSYPKYDWTDGCIALQNKDMEEVWNLVKDQIIVEIKA